jgi:hypothetical protein
MMVDEVVDSKDGIVPDKAQDAVRFTETIEEARAKTEAAGAATPESLGVDQASFDKYHKDGDFDWASYGKEQAFKAAQHATEPAKEPAKEEARQSDAPRHSDTEEAQTKVADAGLDWDGLGVKISEEGDISEADYKALAGIGVPEQVVKQYVEMVKGDAQGLIDDVIEQAGGQESFDAVFDALQDKPMETRKKIDTLLSDPDTRPYGIDLMFKEAGIQRSQPESAPAPPQDMYQGNANNRNPSSAGNTQGYASFEEQVAAQRDPRYRTDLTYRNEVMAKIGASTFNMNPRTHTGGL